MGWSSLGTNEVITKAEIEVLQCSIKLISKGSSGKLPKDITNTSFVHIIGHTDTKGYGLGNVYIEYCNYYRNCIMYWICFIC